MIRDRKTANIPSEGFVLGDIVQLAAGDTIPTDGLLLESKDLFVDEASLTGETYAAEKSISILLAETSLGQRSNSVFMSTHVVSGTGRAVIVCTRKETEFGRGSPYLAGHGSAGHKPRIV